MVDDPSFAPSVSAVAQLIQERRDLHVAAFRDAIQQARQRYGHGTAEDAFAASELPFPYGEVFCSDFVTFGGRSMTVLDFNIPHEPFSKPVCCDLGGAFLSVESLNWGATHIHHDASSIRERKLKHWFDYWFPSEDEVELDEDGWEHEEVEAADSRREDPDVGGIIHLLEVRDGLLTIDFGTAPADAMWDLLDVLRGSGARHIRVNWADEWSSARCGERSITADS